MEQCLYTTNKELCATVITGKDFIEMITEKLVQLGHTSKIEGVHFTIHDGEITANAYFFKEPLKDKE